jgi:hypothetical protein
MIKIIDLVDSKIIVAPECLVIEPFKSIWEKDKSKDKTQAFNMIKYTWYYASFKSPFFQHSNSDKHKLIVDHILKEPKFKMTQDLLDCINMYDKIHTTPAMRLFRAVQESINKMEKFFEDAEYNEDSITKIQKAIIDMPKMQEAVQAALNNCQKEQSTGDKVRGDNVLGMFENQ